MTLPATVKSLNSDDYFDYGEYDDFDDMMEVDEAPVEEEKPADQPAEQPTDQPAATGEVDEFEVVTGPE